jgi:hypothetical protein
MKNKLILLLTLLSTTFSFAQFSPNLSNPIVTAFPFMSLPYGDQARGMANIGVVAGPDYYGTALWDNPALLYRGKQVIGGNLGAQGLELGNPRQYHGTLWLPVGKRGVLATGFRSAKFRQKSFTDFRNSIEGEKALISPHASQTKVSYGFALTNHLSFGSGFGLVNAYDVQPTIHPHLFCGPGVMDSIEMNMWAATADVGLHYQKEFSMSCEEDVRLQWGASVVNMGARVRNELSGVRNFLPTTLQLGGMLGWKKKHKEGYINEVDVAYQMQKLLVPFNGSESLDGAARGMLTSLFDSPLGLHGEFQEVAHQFGLEWRQRFDNGIRAMRAGFFFEDPTLGNRRYLSLGGTVEYYDFFWDVSYILFKLDESYSGRLIGTFGYVKVLGE